VCSVLVLNACGGGGGGSDSVVEPATDLVTTEVDTTDSTSDSSAKLVAADDFDFGSSYTLSLNVERSQGEHKRFGLSLCPDYAEEGGSYSVVYDSCVLKAAFSEGSYSSQMEIGNAIDSLLLVIWHFEDPGKRDYFEWIREGDGPYVFDVK